MLYYMALDLPDSWDHPGEVSIPLNYLNVSVSLLFLACSRGVLKWRKWAHVSAAALLLLEMTLFSVVLGAMWPLSLWIGLASTELTMLSILDLPVLAWLLLPDVRTAYWQPRVTA